MTRLLPLLAWLILATAVLTISTSLTHQAGEAIGEREIYYALAKGQDLKVRLQAGEDRIRILAHLETPDLGLADEQQAWTYGLRITTERPDGQPITREHWTRSRRTLLKDVTPDGGTYPAMLGAKPGALVTDSRVIELEPRHLVPHGGTLRIQPLLEDDGQRLLLRIFREREATPRERLGVAASLEKRTERMEHVYPFSWPELTAIERQNLTAWTRERLSAELLTGESIAIQRLGDPSPVPLVNPEGYPLRPGQATALNLKGPCTLTVDTLLAAPRPGEEATRVPLLPEVVDASARPVRDPLLTPYKVSVPKDALWSLRWTNPWDQDTVLMRFDISPPTGQTWGEPPGSAAEQPLAPETRRFSSFLLDKDMPPILVPLATGEEYGVIAVETRPHPDDAWLGNPTADPLQPPTNITFTAYDDDGRHIGSGRLQAGFEYSPYERYVDDPEARMSEATRVHVFHTYRGSTMAFSADRPVDLRFLVPVEAEPVKAPEYETPEDWQGLYSPWELAPYVTINPLNVDELVRDGRLVRYDATVRLEPDGQGSGSARRSTVEIEPLDTPPRYPLMERFFTAGPWKPWHRTRMEPVVNLDIPRGGELQVDYRITPSLVSQTAFLRCGTHQESDLLIATGGTLTFRGLPPGQQACTFNAPAGDFLAQTAGSGERWSRRTVYRADNRPLRISVPTQANHLVYVYVRSYAPAWGPGPELEILVDDGKPRRHGGPSTTLTRGWRQIRPPIQHQQVRLEDQERGALAAYDGVRIVLGDDLSPGSHTISVNTVWGADAKTFPVYLRFDATEGPPIPSIPQHWSSEARCELVEP